MKATRRKIGTGKGIEVYKIKLDLPLSNHRETYYQADRFLTEKEKDNLLLEMLKEGIETSFKDGAGSTFIFVRKSDETEGERQRTIKLLELCK